MTTAKRTKNIKFTIFCNRMVGETKLAKSVEDLIEKMTKRHSNFWGVIKFKDEENRTISITREFMDDEGMTIEEIIEDHIEFGDLEEDIHSINNI